MDETTVFYIGLTLLLGSGLFLTIYEFKKMARDVEKKAPEL